MQFKERSVPFPHCYWVIPGRFLARRYPGSEDLAEADKRLKALLDHGLRTFMDLAEPWEVKCLKAKAVTASEHTLLDCGPFGRVVKRPVRPKAWLFWG
jgi:hypothetical protein